MPEVDLYAPSENQRPPQYNTRTSVTQAGGPNALRSDWNKRSHFNLFPPPTPSGSTEVCSRLWPFRGQVPLVAPRRKAQPWHATQLRGWPEPSPRNHLALVGCGLHQSGMSCCIWWCCIINCCCCRCCVRLPVWRLQYCRISRGCSSCCRCCIYSWYCCFRNCNYSSFRNCRYCCVSKICCSNPATSAAGTATAAALDAASGAIPSVISNVMMEPMTRANTVISHRGWRSSMDWSSHLNSRHVSSTVPMEPMTRAKRHHLTSWRGIAYELE